MNKPHEPVISDSDPEHHFTAWIAVGAAWKRGEGTGVFGQPVGTAAGWFRWGNAQVTVDLEQLTLLGRRPAGDDKARDDILKWGLEDMCNRAYENYDDNAYQHGWLFVISGSDSFVQSLNTEAREGLFSDQHLRKFWKVRGIPASPGEMKIISGTPVLDKKMFAELLKR